jgi:hypothetical protein
MGTVLQFTKRSFSPDEIDILGQAFDKACQELYDSGRDSALKEIIARRLVAMAGRGERNPDRMCEAALVSLGLREKSEMTGTAAAWVPLTLNLLLDAGGTRQKILRD